MDIKTIIIAPFSDTLLTTDCGDDSDGEGSGISTEADMGENVSSFVVMLIDYYRVS